MKVIYRLFPLIACLALLSCTQDRQYFFKVVTDNGLYPRVSIKAPNDSMANVYGFRAFVAALNVFEEGDGNSSDLSSINYSSMPRGVRVFNSEGKDITNITEEIYREEIKNYVPSQLRLSAEKKDRARIDSLALIAWGDAKFGMTQNEVRKTPQFRGMQKVKSNNENIRYSAPKSTTRQIKEAFDFFYWEPYLYAEFGGKNNDELVEVTLESHKYNWDLFKYMADDYKAVADYISTVYGKPTQSNLDIERYSIKDGELTRIAYWDVGSKRISLYVYSYSRSADYDFEFTIYNIDYPKTKNEEVLQSKAKEQQQKEALKSNTF